MNTAMTRFRRAVVTGGAGFLGVHVCRALLDQGAEVVCLDNFLTSSNSAVATISGREAFRLKRVDVSESCQVEGPVDLVVHLASAAAPADYQRYPLQTMNAGSRGTQNALDLAARAGARFILASTSEVYGDPEINPQPENYWGRVNPIGPRSVYDEAKRFSEALTAAYSRAGIVHSGIARIFNTYGPGMRVGDERMVPTFSRQALTGVPLTVAGDGAQTRSLCHVDDTVRGILLLAASDLAGPVNIGNPDEACVLDIATRIIELAGSSSPIRHVPEAPDDPRVRRPDISLARSALGYEPRVGWRTGLRQTLDWFAPQFATVSPRAVAAGVEGAAVHAAQGEGRGV